MCAFVRYSECNCATASDASTGYFISSWMYCPRSSVACSSGPSTPGTAAARLFTPLPCRGSHEHDRAQSLVPRHVRRGSARASRCSTRSRSPPGSPDRRLTRSGVRGSRRSCGIGSPSPTKVTHTTSPLSSTVYLLRFPAYDFGILGRVAEMRFNADHCVEVRWNNVRLPHIDDEIAFRAPRTLGRSPGPILTQLAGEQVKHTHLGKVWLEMEKQARKPRRQDAPAPPRSPTPQRGRPAEPPASAFP
jgi:hypothetical protein